MSTIRDILDRKGNNVLTVTSQVSVLDAIKNMSEANIGALIVQDGEKAEGIFTERDYLRKIALKGRSSSNTPLRDVMSSPLITIDVTDLPAELCRPGQVVELHHVSHARLAQSPSDCPRLLEVKPPRSGRCCQ